MRNHPASCSSLPDTDRARLCGIPGVARPTVRGNLVVMLVALAS